MAGGQTLTLSNPHDLLTTDAGTFVRWLQTGRPTPVSPHDRARILASLPAKGQVPELDASARQKLADLGPLLRASERDSVYVVKVIDVPQAVVALHGRTVVLVSQAALNLVSAAELQALVAHEIGHEYVWPEYERAAARDDHNRLKELELLCDMIAVATLHGLRMDVFRLMSGVEKVSRFNRERFGVALNENGYPATAERRALARAVLQWTSAPAIAIRR